jgi:hypothetical protein
MKETTHKLILIIFISIILTSCSFIGQSETDSETSSGTVEPLNTEIIESPHASTQVSDLGPGELPVIISYIEESDGQEKIISTALNFQSDYLPIVVKKDTYFRGSVAFDIDLNLYIVYGSENNYLSKLSIDGKVETIEIPYKWQLQTLWAGNKLFVLAKESSMAVINTDLAITTLSPAINILEDGTASDGSLGITNDPITAVVWVSSIPVEDETGDFALYRTLSLDTLTTSEFKLEIPDSDWNWYESNPTTQDADERLGTIVYGIDIQSENVLLCYNYKKWDDGVVYSNIELFASKIGESITSFDYCCMNKTFDIRGNSIIENAVPETCSTTQVLGLSNLQPLFDVTEFLDSKNRLANWVGSNGVYWQILSNNKVTVINSNLLYEVSYPFPSYLTIDLIPGTTLLPAFSIEE